jgi:hypothetical protein
MMSLMAPRQTNLALLALAILAVISGFGAFAIGTKPGQWVVVAHGVIGLAILALAPWKSMIARRGLTRERTGRVISLILAGMVLVTILSGLVLVSGIADRLGPLTMTQIHVGAALVTLALVAVHYLQRPVRPRRQDLSRRSLIRASAILGAGGAAYLLAEGIWAVTGAPGSRRRFTGSHEIVEASLIPATQWLDDRVQHLDGSTHTVRVAGRDYAAAELSGFGDSMVATLDCTGGWYSTQEWSGARLDRLLGDADGLSIVVRSVTGYWRRFPVVQGRKLLLATHLAGQPLPDGNGGPVRLVAPDRRGFWWVKWVATVETDDLPPWWQPPLPLS